jgi:hypothetical protein
VRFQVFHGGEYEDDCLLGCCACSLVEVTDVSEVLALMMEAASTSETSLNFYQTTRCNIPEDSLLYPQLSPFHLHKLSLKVWAIICVDLDVIIN